MRKTATLFLCSLLVFVFAGVGHAQMWPQEDHFKVYNTAPPITLTRQVDFIDQFGGFPLTDLRLEKFATPVIKNNEEWYDLTRHQTWWRIQQLMPEIWKVNIQNQFGLQVWYLQNASYVVLPALKYQPGVLPIANHYKCYDVFRNDTPLPQIVVNLKDQFDTLDVVVGDPVVFCNPAEKVDENGLVYPIEDPFAHLACYHINPKVTYGNLLVTAFDQFGTWNVELVDQDWLCVPTEKIVAVPAERSTWGRIKQRYND